MSHGDWLGEAWYAGVRAVSRLAGLIAEYPLWAAALLVLFCALRFLAQASWPLPPVRVLYFLLDWAGWLARRDLVLYPVSLAAGFLMACALLASLDSHLQDQVEQATTAVLEGKLRRARRPVEPPLRAVAPAPGRGEDPEAGTAVGASGCRGRGATRQGRLVAGALPGRQGEPGLGHPPGPVELPTRGASDPTGCPGQLLEGTRATFRSRAPAVAKDPKAEPPPDPTDSKKPPPDPKGGGKPAPDLKKSPPLEKKQEGAPAGPAPAKSDPLQAIERAFALEKVKRAELARAVGGPLKRLLHGEEAALTEQDLDDLALLFTATAGGLRLRAEVEPFLHFGWAPGPESLVSAARAVYAPPLPPASDPAAVEDLWQRLGTVYPKPVARDLVKGWSALVRDYAPGGGSSKHARDPHAERLMAFALAALLTPAERLRADGTLAPEEYELSGSVPAKALATRHYEKIQNELVEAIDKRSVREEPGRSGATARKRPFRLDVTDQDLRAMLRGPIQLITFTAFFTALTVLVLKGLLFGFWDQLALLLVWDVGDRLSLERWCDLWHVKGIRLGDPARVAKILRAADGGENLIAGQLAAAVRALVQGGTLREAVDASEKAAEEWTAARREEFVFLDYVEYLLPALGFVGTLIGNGLGLGQANRVAIPDAQVESISDMTTHLGQSFYATLVALSCSIVYLLCRALVSRLQASLVRWSRQRMRGHLVAYAGPEAP